MKKTLLALLVLSLLFSYASCIAGEPVDDPVTADTESSESTTEMPDETEPSPDGSISSEDGTDAEEVTGPVLQYPTVIYTLSSLHVTDENIEIRDDVENMNFGMQSHNEKVELEKDSRLCFVNGSEKTLTYTGTWQYRYSDCAERVARNYSRDFYVDDEKNSYEYYGDTDIVRCFYKKEWDPAPDSPKKSKSQLKAIAKETILQFSGIDMDESPAFEESIGYGDGATFGYTYTFCGYETEESIVLRLNSAGEVIEYKHYNAMLYREWDGVLNKSDIERAAGIIHYPSDMAAGPLTQSLTVGNDGYLYVKLSKMEFAYDETDAEGNVVVQHPVRFTEHYVRVTPAA